MSPKSSSVGRPWHGRTRSSKSIADVPSKCTSVPKSSAPPSSTSTAYQDDRVAPPPPSNTTATVSSDQNKSALQTKNSSPGENSSHSQEKALILFSPNRINVRDETQEKKLRDSSSLDAEVGTKPTNLGSADGQEVTIRDGHETLVDPEKAAADADTVRIVVEGGKRKVFKKVKVIKKVVKRVMKKVPKSCLEGSDTKRVVHGGNFNGNTQSLETESNVLLSEQIGKTDPIDNDTLEDVKFETNDIAPLGDEPSEVPFSVHSEGKVSEGIQNHIKYGKDSGYIVEQNAVSLEKGASNVERVQNQIEDAKYGRDFVGDQNVVQVEEGASGVEEVVKEFRDGNVAVLMGDSGEDHNAVQVEEGASEVEEVEKAFIENNGVGLSGDSVEVRHMIKVEDGIGASEVEEVVKELVENNGASLSGGVAASREIEAVEKRNCWQRDIFLGGLDKDTKEEDIWKIFENVDKVTGVRLKMNSKTGKNKGFAFVRFASAADAKKAFEKYSKVEICGKQCAVQPVGGSDTLFLGNINKKWKDDDVMRLLNQEGIEKIEKVTVKFNPNNLEQNRGFAFVELETSKDAEIAYDKLQKNYVFNQQMKIKVAWAQPLFEPDEKEVLKVKSICAEFIPSSWDEKKLKIFFKRFGEIESITLARNLPSSHRKDFAFVTYTTRDAALACIGAFNHEQVDEDGSKVNVKVSLANPQKRSKQKKHVLSSTRKEHSRNETKTSQSILKVHGPGNEEIRTSNNHEVIGDRMNSTTVELIHLLRQQQASHRPMQAGSSDLDYHYSLSGSKRTFHELDGYVPSSDSRGFLHTRQKSSPLAANPSSFPHHIGSLPFPYSQQRSFGYTFESFHGIPNNLHFQKREQSQFFGHNPVFQR